MVGRWARVVLAFAGLTLLTTAETAGFSLLPNVTTGSVEGNLRRATRWSAEADPFGLGTGLHDRIQVAVAADFAEQLQRTSAEDRAAIESVIRNAFAAWQTPDLRFDVDFTRTAVEGVDPTAAHGFEIDLFAVPETHPVFASGEVTYFGYTFVQWREDDRRLLTNGARTAGMVTLAADIFINVDSVLEIGSILPRDKQISSLQRLLMHEIGHALGFGHPNGRTEDNVNYDTDEDPANEMVIDPRSPFVDLVRSPNRPSGAILSNERQVGSFLFFTRLTNDDRGGRDTLYPSLTSCAADCDGDGLIDVAEVLTGVAIALGESPLPRCSRADRDGDGNVFVDELIVAIDQALAGCVPVQPAAPRPKSHLPRSGAGGTIAVGCDNP